MKNQNKVSRRKFVQKMAETAIIAGVVEKFGSVQAIAQMIGGTDEMATRPLGRMGRRVSLFSLGGQATLEESGRDADALAIINRAIDLGVNYIDTAAAYGSGISETYIGKVMKQRRKEVFLASKTHARSYDGSMRLLERSLNQLKTDHLDLWQLHNVRTQDDLEKIFAKEGAIKALEKARDEKMVRFLGITGHHDPFILRTGIERYPFDSILMALNAADKHNASFIDNLLPVAVEKKMSIVGMKVPARGRIFRENGLSSMEQAMRYVLTLPVSTIIVGISVVKELEENVRIAKSFKPCSAEEMAELERLTKPYYSEASWFKELW